MNTNRSEQLPGEIPHDYEAITRSSIAQVCEILGLDPHRVSAIHLDAYYLDVEGLPDDRPLRLRVVAD